MNIFVTDDCPIKSAHNLCDQHVRSKMQIEGAIMLAHCFTQELLDHPSHQEHQQVEQGDEVKVTSIILALFGVARQKIILSG